MDNILTALTPSLLQILSLVLTALIGWAAARFQKWTGLQIEARHRDALHQALMTAATAAVSRNMTEARAVDFIEGYVAQSSPDALRALKPSAGVLAELARAKLAEAMQRITR